MIIVNNNILEKIFKKIVLKKLRLFKFENNKTKYCISIFFRKRMFKKIKFLGKKTSNLVYIYRSLGHFKRI